MRVRQASVWSFVFHAAKEASAEGQNPETADGDPNLLFCYSSQICISLVSNANAEHV